MGIPHRIFSILTKPASASPLQKIVERIAVSIGHRFPENKLVQSVCRAFSDNILHHEGGNTERVATLLTSGKVVFEFTDATKMYYFLGTDDSADEVPVAKLLMRMVRPGDVFFDIGANVGFFTFLVAPLCGKSGSVHAFEANPRLVRNLSRSVELNQNISSIVVNGVAVGERDGGDIPLYFSSDLHDIGVTSTYPHPWLNAKSQTNVPLISIDGYMQRQSLERIDYMKIDIEGGEMNAFKGMAETFNRHRPSMIICELLPREVQIGNAELLPDHTTPPSIEILDFLTAQGYEPRHISLNGYLGAEVRRDEVDTLHHNKINVAFVTPQLKNQVHHRA